MSDVRDAADTVREALAHLRAFKQHLPEVAVSAEVALDVLVAAAERTETAEAALVRGDELLSSCGRSLEASEAKASTLEAALRHYAEGTFDYQTARAALAAAGAADSDAEKLLTDKAAFDKWDYDNAHVPDE